MGVPRVDLAIAGDGLLAVVPGIGTTIEVPIRLEPGNGDSAQALQQAISALEQKLLEALSIPASAGGPRFLVRVALLPPLCEVRLIDLPRLGHEETELVLRRNAPKHFIGVGRDPNIGFARYGIEGEEGGSRVFAAATSDSLLEVLRTTVEGRGWELETVVPAAACWLHTLERTGPTGGRREVTGGPASVRAVFAADGSMLTVIRLAGRAPDQLRRVPIQDAQAIARSAGPVPGWGLVLGPESTRTALTAELRTLGWNVDGGRSTMTAREAAARDIAGAPIEFVPAPVLAARQRRSRRLGARMLAVAALLIVAAGAVHLAALAREIRAAERERAELRERVAPVATARDSLDGINEALRELRQLEVSARPLTVPLIELSVLLPPESHLLSVRVAGDTAVFEAAGGRAGTALAALRSASTLTDVRLEGTIQREIEGGTTAGERFTLSALLDASADLDGSGADSAPGGGGR